MPFHEPDVPVPGLRLKTVQYQIGAVESRTTWTQERREAALAPFKEDEAKIIESLKRLS